MKTLKTDSVKTPGGISKALLTPCRRVGLSRNWKRSSISPFVSPLTANNSSPLQNNPETRKRKIPEDVGIPDQSQSGQNSDNDEPLSVIENCSPKYSNVTPSRKVERLSKRRSKILAASIKSSQDIENIEIIKQKKIQHVKDELDNGCRNIIVGTVLTSEDETNHLDFPLKTKEHKDDLIVGLESSNNNVPKTNNNKCLNSKYSELSNPKKQQSIQKPETADSVITDEKLIDITKPKGPNELTTECVVFIQKKLFKAKSKDIKRIQEISNTKKCLNKLNAPSQVFFDSDSDDVPLSHINKEKITAKDEKNDDDEFIKNTKTTTKVKKLVDKNTSTGGLTANSATPKINSKLSKVNLNPVQITSPSHHHNTFDDDEDFDLNNKKTIIIKKTYEKVSKPLKAKSTGSISQKDIDEIKSRIEAKKKLLITRALTGETDELRALIKQWQKGCQNAVMDLMELMKTKCPDKQNMDYMEMLQSLKIPAKLVGYDPENDCFISPDDSSILLSWFNDC